MISVRFSFDEDGDNREARYSNIGNDFTSTESSADGSWNSARQASEFQFLHGRNDPAALAAGGEGNAMKIEPYKSDCLTGKTVKSVRHIVNRFAIEFTDGSVLLAGAYDITVNLDESSDIEGYLEGYLDGFGEEQIGSEE